MKYDFKSIQNDFRASIVVFLVALPLCLGISLASGAPLISGILSGIIGGIVVGFFSNSRVSVSGPAAGLTIIVLNAIESLGDFYMFTLAVLLSGIFQIILGLVKAGSISAFFPSSVIKGMLSAIGIILIVKQIPYLLGLHDALVEHEMDSFRYAMHLLEIIHPGVLIVGALSIVALVLWSKLDSRNIKFFKIIPAPLFVVILGILLNELMFKGSSVLVLGSSKLVSLPIEGGISSFLSVIKFPVWDAIFKPEVFKVAIILTIVGSIETLLSVEATDKIDPKKHNTDKNKELIAQGLGNMTAGLIGAIPMTSVIVRSSANIEAGVSSKWSAVLHGVWLFLAVALITNYLELIPLASLAAILIVVGYKLASPKIVKEIVSHGRDQLIPFIVTIVAILVSDLLMGVLIGIITSILVTIHRQFDNSIVFASDEGDFLIKITKDVSFYHKPQLLNIFAQIPDGSTVVIDGLNSFHVDKDIIGAIEEFKKKCKEKNISLDIVSQTSKKNI